MTTTTAPPPASLPAPVQIDWSDLAADGAPSPPSAAREHLPPAARRWLDRAVAPAAEGVRSAELRMHGWIRIGRRRPFRARQVIAPGEGFVWAASTGLGPLGVRGYDRYTHGEGEMRWRLLGIVPVMTATGADVTRSAAGRLAGETVLCPAGALAAGVRWEPGGDDDHAVAVVPVGPWEHRVTIAVGADGALRGVEMERWGAPDGGPFDRHVFRVAFDGEIAADGCTIPATMHAGWRTADGRDLGVSLRATIDEVSFR